MNEYQNAYLSIFELGPSPVPAMLSSELGGCEAWQALAMTDIAGWALPRVPASPTFQGMKHRGALSRVLAGSPLYRILLAKGLPEAHGLCAVFKPFLSSFSP